VVDDPEDCSTETIDKVSGTIYDAYSFDNNGRVLLYEITIMHTLTTIYRSIPSILYRFAPNYIYQFIPNPISIKLHSVHERVTVYDTIRPNEFRYKRVSPGFDLTSCGSKYTYVTPNGRSSISLEGSSLQLNMHEQRMKLILVTNGCSYISVGNLLLQYENHNITNPHIWTATSVNSANEIKSNYSYFKNYDSPLNFLHYDNNLRHGSDKSTQKNAWLAKIIGYILLNHVRQKFGYGDTASHQRSKIRIYAILFAIVVIILLALFSAIILFACLVWRNISTWSWYAIIILACAFLVYKYFNKRLKITRTHPN